MVAFLTDVIYLFESDSIDRISNDTNTSDVFIIKFCLMFKWTSTNEVNN